MSTSCARRFGEALILLIIADAIGVPLDGDVEIGTAREDAGDSGESFASDVGETRARGDEKNVGHIMMRPRATRVLQEQVQLLAKFARASAFFTSATGQRPALSVPRSCLLQFITHARSVVAFTFDFCSCPGGIPGFTFGSGLGLCARLRLTLGFSLCLAAFSSSRSARRRSSNASAPRSSASAFCYRNSTS